MDLFRAWSSLYDSELNSINKEDIFHVYEPMWVFVYKHWNVNKSERR